MAKTVPALYDPLNFLQQGSDAWKKMLQPIEVFWGGQRKLVPEYEKLAASLLKRRREGTDAAINAVHEMQNCSSPAEWAKCYSEWVAGSLSRLASDSQELMAESFQVLNAMSLGTENAGDAPPPETTAARPSAAKASGRA